MAKEDDLHHLGGLLLLHLHAVRAEERRAMFQRTMRACLEAQTGHNAEAYIDDIVVKTKHQRTLLEDLDETFNNLSKINLKLSPEKCVFGAS